MAETQAYIGYGMTLGIGDGASSEDFSSLLAEVISIDGPERVRDTVEVTHATSPNRYREFVDGLKDGSEVSMELNMVQADYVALEAIYDDSDSKNNYLYTLPDKNFTGKPTILFAGYITSLNISSSTDDKVTLSVTLKVTGPVTYTPGS
jgi:predicted secreted protein